MDDFALGAGQMGAGAGGGAAGGESGSAADQRGKQPGDRAAGAVAIGEVDREIVVHAESAAGGEVAGVKRAVPVERIGAAAVGGVLGGGDGGIAAERDGIGAGCA